MEEAIREDFDALLEPLLEFAVNMLGEHGEFFPFASAVTDAGEVTLVAAELEQEQPEVQEVVDLLVERLRELAGDGEIRASGIVVNATLDVEDAEAPTDGALVHLEHRDGEPLDVVLPYETHGDHVHTGELIAAPGTTRVFGAASS